ncbi:hypothetical protein M514_20437 [Trichuris suis]|uniref:Uncharacterized protein n=1 Tax=Trichuris suis TaxID=68888 RepID=A0A085ND55_9BILA|nr:hypothetical protein M514_20437 [Trichuris suis]
MISSRSNLEYFIPPSSAWYKSSGDGIGCALVTNALFRPVEKSAHKRTLLFGFLAMTIGAAQSDCSTGVRTPISTYLCSSASTAPRRAYATGNGFLSTAPCFSSMWALSFLQCPNSGWKRVAYFFSTSSKALCFTCFTSAPARRKDCNDVSRLNARIQSLPRTFVAGQFAIRNKSCLL